MVTDTHTRNFVSPIKSFDQRLSSDLSLAPLSPPKFITRKVDKAVHETTSLQSNSKSFLFDEGNNNDQVFEWMKLKKISEFINSTSFKEDYGSAVYLTVGEAFIAVATTKRYVVLFNYSQDLVVTVESKNIGSGIQITAMSLSIDSTHLVVGYSSGHINLWDLKKPEPIIAIEPVSLAELQYNGTHHHISHYENTPIRKLKFLGPRHTAFISSDDSGMLISHNGGRSLVGFYCRSSIIYGEYKTLKMEKYEYDKDTLLNFDILPVGSVPSLADSIALIAILTPQKILVLSLYPSLRYHFVIPNTTLNECMDKISGHLEWYPSVKDDDTSEELDASLVFCWSSDIQIARIQPKIVTLDGNDNELTIQFRLDALKSVNEPSVSLKWLNHRLIIALTNSQKLMFFDSINLTKVYEIDMKAKNIHFLSMIKHNNIGIIDRSYLGSLCTFKSNLFMFQNGNILVCRMKNWADILLEQLNAKDYISAMRSAKNQYQGHTDLALIGLPENAEKRHSIMKEYLKQIVQSSVKYIFNPAYESSFNIETKLDLFFDVALMLDLPEDTYDLVYEILMKYHKEEYFFEAIQEYTLDHRNLSLSPSVLNAMVSFYIDQQNINTLEKLICTLDMEKLNIDMVVTLCQKYHLNETLTYIWTFLFKDYLMPLNIAIQRILEFHNNYDNMNMKQKDAAIKDIQYVYSYLSYILTGRQYPTENMLFEEESSRAKLEIYGALFNGIVTDSSGTSFSDIYLLLSFDSGSMFACLNESFEDEVLNTTENDTSDFQINRQYIIDILFNIFKTKEEKFTQIDRIRFGIFVSRNYSKYPQFIRLSDSMANEIIDLLCSICHLDPDEKTELLLKDCELGMLSLLSIYKPIDIEVLLLKLEKAEFFNALMALYQSEEKYNDILKLWVKLQRQNKDGSSNLNKPISFVLEHELKYGDKLGTVRLLHDNLEFFVKSDLNKVASLVCELCPQVNAQVVNFSDSHLKFEYLKVVFNLTGTGKGSIDEKLQIEFLQDMVKQRDNMNSLLETCAENQNLYNSTKTKQQAYDSKIKIFVLGLPRLDSAIIEILRKNNYSVLVDWYVEKNDYISGTNLILELFNETSQALIKSGYLSELDVRLWQLLEFFFTTVSGTNKELQRTVGDLTLQESLIVRMIEGAVDGLSSALQKENTQVETVDSLKKILQSIFQFTIDMSRDDSLIFSTILKTFLDRPCTTETRIGNISFVVKEFFLSYRNTRQILKIIQDLLNDEIFDDLRVLDSLKLKGRSPQNIECETCGKKVWGGRVGNKVYEYWRTYMLQKAFCWEEDIYEGVGDLLIFKCKHAYHKKCVENMGMLSDETKECIVCKGVV